MAKQGAVYCAFTGGAAVLATKAIRRVVNVQWLDLGMPEATWIFEVEQFGPLIVAIDSMGKNLFADVCEKVQVNKKQIYQKLDL
jgi:fumarate hydratase subunit beta